MHNILQDLANPISVYFVRHGESQHNTAGRIQGKIDGKLSQTGRRQAELLADWFKHSRIHLDTVYTSPLERAKETATILSERLQLATPQPLSELRELDTGIWTGKSLSELKKTSPELFYKFTQDSWEAIPEAESISSLLHRAQKLWHYLVQRANSGTKTMLCVSHSGFMQWIFKSTFRPAPQHWIPLLRITNCAVFHFSCIPNNYTTTAGWSLINYPIPELLT